MIWKTLGKKNETQIQNTIKCHSSRLEQAEDRISEHKDKNGIKGETKSY
jgi:hypothetical protein